MKKHYIWLITVLAHIMFEKENDRCRCDGQVIWPFVNVENTPDSVPKQHQHQAKYCLHGPFCWNPQQKLHKEKNDFWFTITFLKWGMNRKARVQAVQGQEGENVCYNLFSEKRILSNRFKNIFNSRNLIQSLHSINYQHNKEAKVSQL